VENEFVKSKMMIMMMLLLSKILLFYCTCSADYLVYSFLYLLCVLEIKEVKETKPNHVCH